MAGAKKGVLEEDDEWVGHATVCCGPAARLVWLKRERRSVKKSSNAVRCVCSLCRCGRLVACDIAAELASEIWMKCNGW